MSKNTYAHEVLIIVCLRTNDQTFDMRLDFVTCERMHLCA